MKLLITRSEPGASRMAERLKAAGEAAAGLECVVRPLLAAQATDSPLPGDCFEHVIFVSEHAVQMGRVAVETLVPGARWYAVGPTTGAALTKWMERAGRSQSERVVIPELAQSEGLLAEPGLQSIERHRVLLVAGEGGRTLIADTLEDRGAQVTTWLVYRRTALDTDISSLADIDICIASSGEGLELLTRQWFNRETKGQTEVPVCVPSPRIAKMAVKLGWQEPIICGGASAEAILEGLAGAGLMDGKPS